MSNNNNINTNLPDTPLEEMPLSALRNSHASPDCCNLRTAIPCKHTYGSPDCSACRFNGLNSTAMTVADLISALQGYPPAAPVLLPVALLDRYAPIRCITLTPAHTTDSGLCDYALGAGGEAVVLSAHILGEDAEPLNPPCHDGYPCPGASWCCDFYECGRDEKYVHILGEE